jgi:DNA mismatch repair protein MutS
VVERAKQILAQLENQALDSEGRAKIAKRRRAGRAGDLQLSLFAPADPPVVEALRGLDLNATTPLEALAWLERWQTELAPRERPEK